jgi:hypothetical protein
MICIPKNLAFDLYKCLLRFYKRSKILDSNHEFEEIHYPNKLKMTRFSRSDLIIMPFKALFTNDRDQST